MPPIPLHIDEPITPQKAQGVTPQTAGSPTTSAESVDASTTAVSGSIAGYPAARPGAAAVPAPTATASTPAAYLPPPTRTTAGYQPPSSDHNTPPAPQPGAVPVAPTTTLQSPTSSSSTAASALPAPPSSSISGPATTTAMPPQFSIPPPPQPFAPTHSTAYPAAAFNTAQQVHQPPGGYQQNLFAQELSSAQRAGLEEQERLNASQASLGESLAHKLGGAGNGIGGGAGLIAGGGGVGSAGGGGVGGVGLEGTGEAVNNAWNAVKGWASSAGTKLAETEEEVWRRINSRS